MTDRHDKAKNDQEEFTARNFVRHLASVGIKATSLRRGGDPLDFFGTIAGEQWAIEVTLADARMPEVFADHRARLDAGTSFSVATTSAAWGRGPLYSDPVVSARNNLADEISARLFDKLQIDFADAARTYVVIDASAFPFASEAEADSFAGVVRAELCLPHACRLAGVRFVLALPGFLRRHYALNR